MSAPKLTPPADAPKIPKGCKFRKLLPGETAQLGDEFTACNNGVNLPPHNMPGSRGWILVFPHRSGMEHEHEHEHGFAGHIVTKEETKQGFIYRRPIKDITPAPKPAKKKAAVRSVTSIKLAISSKRAGRPIKAHIRFGIPGGKSLNIDQKFARYFSGLRANEVIPHACFPADAESYERMVKQVANVICALSGTNASDMDTAIAALACIGITGKAGK